MKHLACLLLALSMFAGSPQDQAARKYFFSEFVCIGSPCELVIKHSLGTEDVDLFVYDGNNGELIFVPWRVTSKDQITVHFAFSQFGWYVTTTPKRVRLGTLNTIRRSR